MSTTLTEREETILNVIKTSIQNNGYPPSVREIGEKVGLKSSSTVHSYLKRLEDKGKIRRDATKPRAIEVTKNKYQDNLLPNHNWIPIVGDVAAGQPLLAVENTEGYFPLPYDFTGEGEFFMLSIKGESMIEAGIFDGDWVVVRKQSSAENGDIVVALLEEEATVKRFFKESNHIKLQPENQFMSPIITRDAKILGKVTGLIRKV
ncbi:MAG: transcriptional repressor LexA [Clostridiales bacterium]|nr:transcriptional repressor LexA [Clostridiales bacterium]MCF8023274.1 transcriptional repressor LexA [Clostridiales bacterium]